MSCVKCRRELQLIKAKTAWLMVSMCRDYRWLRAMMSVWWFLSIYRSTTEERRK